MQQQGVRGSPLRPRSISSALAAVARQGPQGNDTSFFAASSTTATVPIFQPSEAPPGRAVQQSSMLSVGQPVGCTIGMPCSPRLSDMMFELPENVSRRPLQPKPPHEVDHPHQRGASGTKRGTKRKLSAGVDLWGVKKSRRFLSGFERAAARKRRQYFAKRAVSRRVALWRARIVDGERQTMYVTLGGEALPKSGRAFRLATSEQKYLKSNGIVSNKPQDSAIDRPERLAPYTTRSDNPRTLGYYCIPESVEVAYRDAGVRQLYAWQAECLASHGVLDGRSLVYVAPTSAGKSLVAEVIMLRQLLFRGRRALLILPYVSICVEKVAQLRRLWGGCGVRIEALYSNSEGTWHCGADIAVCTIEKASSLLNHLLEEDCLLRDVGTIVIDEMHILGEEHRGYILELILVKARLSARLAAPADPAGALQIIGLSATLPNVNVLAEWLGAHLYVSDSRPVPLSLSVASRGQIMESSSQSAATLSQSGSASLTPRDPDGLVPLVWESIAEGHSVLVFCATKEWCEKAAVLVAEEVLLLEGASENGTKADARFKTLEELRQLPAGLCPVLARTISQGVAYHHAGLTVEERAIVEEAFRSGSICCLCATSTLAAGVNLPARRVIIRSMSVGNAPLDATRFKQMAGRAGRAGFDTLGECVVMTRSAKDVDSAKSLFSAQLVEVQSGLKGQRLERAVLEVISLCLVRSMDDLRKLFVPMLLRYLDIHARESLMQDLQAAVSHLEELLLVRVDRYPSGNGNSSVEQLGSTSYEGTSGEVQRVDSNGDATGNDPTLKASLMTTPLGDGVVASSLSPVDALSAFQDLQRARSGICLDTDLHIVFLATPVNGSTEPDWARFLSMYERLPPRERAACDRIGISHEFLIQEALGRRKTTLSTSVTGHAGDVRSDRERTLALHRRFWAAFALCELLAEKPLHKVAAAHRIPRGALQALQQQAGTYCTLVKCLCERLRWHEMAAIFEGLRPRLNFGVSVEAAPLCRISGVHAHQARALIDAGYTTVEHVARASNYDVERALSRLRPFESICKDRRLALLQDDVARNAARKIVASAQDLVSSDTQNVEDEAEVEERRVMAAIAHAPTAARANGPLPRIN